MPRPQREDSIARGMCHGRAGVVNKTRKRAESSGQTTAGSLQSTVHNTLQQATSLGRQRPPLQFINTSCQDVIFYLQTDRITVHDSINHDVPLSYDDTPSPAHQEQAGSITRVLGNRWAPLLGNISRTESRLLDFNTAIVCAKATILDERAHNPFRFVLLPMAMHSTRIYHGLLAVAAGKMAATGQDSHVLALIYRHYALGGLRQLLSTLGTEPHELVEALAAISVLLDACTDHPAMPAYAQDIVRFGWQYFAYHLVMAKTTFPMHNFIPTSPSPSVPIVNSSTSICSRHRRYRLDASKNAYIDAYQGFSNTLLFLIDEVCELRTASQTSTLSSTLSIDCLACGDSQRQRILHIFSLLETTMFHSIPPARKVVEMVWRQQDLTVDENPRVAASWQGPFRTWKRAADPMRHDECGGHKNGGKMPKPPCNSAAAQFPWERAMSIVGECKLSLT